MGLGCFHSTTIPGETACRSGISGRGGGCGLHGNQPRGPPFQAKRRVAAAFQEEEAAVDSMGTNPGADPRPQAALEELRTLAEAEETEVG